MFYRKVLRPVLLKLQPKQAHTLALSLLEMLRTFRLTRIFVQLLYKRRTPAIKTEVFGIDFRNPVGLAAGFDTNAQFGDVISDAGFGFIEVGPITPKPEKAPEIANKGLMAVISNLKDRRPKSIIGANLTHNSTTPEEEIGKDIVKDFTLLYDFVDFFVINTSIKNNFRRSPLEDPEFLSDVMDEVLDKRMGMDKLKPVLLKISPDMPHDQLDDIISYSMSSGIDGVVAGDIDRNNDNQFDKNLELVKYIHGRTKGRMDIIGCGNIITPEQSKQMLDAGASLIELYTGIFYEGPVLVRRTLKHLQNSQNSHA